MVVPRDGLGFPWIQGLVVPIVATVGGAVATKLIAGPSSPSQKEIEAAIKVQTRADVERMYAAASIQQQQTEELGSYLVPALGVLALVMLLR